MANVILPFVLHQTANGATAVEDVPSAAQEMTQRVSVVTRAPAENCLRFGQPVLCRDIEHMAHDNVADSHIDVE